MKVVAVIPARMASTRFPGKPLAEILGYPMIEHVYRRVACSELIDEVYLATCDTEVADTIFKLGGNAIMTSASHTRCLDRVAEAVDSIQADLVVTVQGDEPMVDPKGLDKAVSAILSNRETPCLNMTALIRNWDSFNSPNVVKVCTDKQGRILCFSRLPIPRQNREDFDFGIKQLGIYMIPKPLLLDFTSWDETPIEKKEQVDMFRFLENGVSILSYETSDLIGVDTQEDLEQAERLLVHDPLYRSLFN